MNGSTTYEKYPFRMIAVTQLLNVLIYALGASILRRFGTLMAGIYLLYCCWFEIRVMRFGCVGCYYYGKACAFGRGTIAALLFKQGDPRRFATRTMSRKELVPDMLVVVLPLIGGIVLLVRSFSWSLTVFLLLLLTLSLRGNYLVRTRITCAHCKQREIGCPAERFFNKEKPG